MWAHINCALWSSEVYENEVGHILQLNDAVKRARGLKCTLCTNSGATIGCSAPHCFKLFHFGCARDAGCLFGIKEVRCRKGQWGPKRHPTLRSIRLTRTRLPTHTHPPRKVYCTDHVKVGRATGRMLKELDPKLPEKKLLELAFKVDRHLLPRHLAFDLERDAFHQRPLPPTRNTVEALAALVPGSSLTRMGCNVRLSKREDGRIDAQAYSLRRGGLCVVFFGSINWHSLSFHTPESLYPVGYTAYRRFFDICSPFGTTLYMCRIRAQDERPLFEVGDGGGRLDVVAVPSVVRRFCLLSSSAFLKIP